MLHQHFNADGQYSRTVSVLNFPDAPLTPKRHTKFSIQIHQLSCMHEAQVLNLVLNLVQRTY
jgi:hypothetical protein